MKNILTLFVFMLSYSLYAVSDPPEPFSGGPGPPPPTNDLSIDIYLYILVIGALFIALNGTKNNTKGN